jgi:hypothetical protein
LVMKTGSWWNTVPAWWAANWENPAIDLSAMTSKPDSEPMTFSPFSL